MYFFAPQYCFLFSHWLVDHTWDIFPRTLYWKITWLNCGNRGPSIQLELRVKSQRISLSRTTNYLPWITSLEIFGTGIILLHIHPKVIYCICVKFHQSRFTNLVGVYKTYRQTDGQTGCFLYTPQKLLIRRSIKKQIHDSIIPGFWHESRRERVVCPCCGTLNCRLRLALWHTQVHTGNVGKYHRSVKHSTYRYSKNRENCTKSNSCKIQKLHFFNIISVCVLLVLRGHSFFSSPSEWPMTSDLKDFYSRFYLLQFLSYLNSWARASISLFNVEYQTSELLVPFL